MKILDSQIEILIGKIIIDLNFKIWLLLGEIYL